MRSWSILLPSALVVVFEVFADGAGNFAWGFAGLMDFDVADPFVGGLGKPPPKFEEGFEDPAELDRCIELGVPNVAP